MHIVGCGEHVHEPLIQSTLLTTKADMGFENDLATAYTCSDDGLTCHVEAKASAPAALIQEFWMYDGAWHIVQLVLSALDTTVIEADEAETAVLTGRL